MRYALFPMSGMMRAVAVLLVGAAVAFVVLTAFGCAPATQPMDAQDLAATEATIAAWEETLGPVSPEDRAYVLGLEVVEMDLAEVQEECGISHPVLGCSYAEAGYYMRARGLVPNDRWHLASHEALHVLSWLTWGDADGDHEDARVWSQHRVGTVEAMAFDARPWAGAQ